MRKRSPPMSLRRGQIAASVTAFQKEGAAEIEHKAPKFRRAYFTGQRVSKMSSIARLFRARKVTPADWRFR